MNNKLAVAALIFPLMMTSAVAYSADTINSFDELKKAVNNDKKDQDVTIELGNDIDFDENSGLTTLAEIIIGKNGQEYEKQNITIVGNRKSDDGTGSSFVNLIGKNMENAKETESKSDAFIVYQGSSLTLKNLTVKNFHGKTYSPLYKTITLVGGKLVLTAEKDQDVIFENNGHVRGGGGDVSLISEGSELLINGSGGKVVLGSGVSGSVGTVKHEGSSLLVLGGNNTGFTGSFTNENGHVEVGKNGTLFGKSNTFQNGQLIWNSQKDLLNTTSALSLSGNASLIVGEDESVNAKLTLKKGQTHLDSNVSLTTKNNGELILSGWQNGFKEQVSGNGKLTLQNTNLNITNDEIKEHDLLQVKLDDQSAVTGAELSFATLTNDGTVTSNNELEVQNYIDNGGTISGKIIIAGSLDNTGKIKAESLTLSKEGSEGKESLINGVAVTENQGATTPAEIETISLNVTGDVKNNGTITVTDEAKVSGNVTNESGKFSAKNLEVSGNITNNGELTAQEKLSGQKLTNTGTVSGYTVETDDIENSGTITIQDSLTAGTVKNNQKSNITLVGGTGTISGTVENDGTITNSGHLTIEGAVSGTGALKNENGTLTLNSDSNSFTGTFTQTGDSTTLVKGTLGGMKNIEGGSLKMTSDSMYTGQVKLGNNASFDFTFNTVEDSQHQNIINNDSLTFAGSNATATFTGIDKSRLTLSDNVQNSKNNNISFDNTTLELSGRNYEYQSFHLKDSTLSLGGESGELEEYVFRNFHTSGSSVDLNLELSAEEKLNSDTLTFKGTSSGTLNLGKVYLTDESGDKEGTFTHDVVKNESGSNVSLGIDGDSHDVYIASNSYTYDLQVKNNTQVSLTKEGITTNKTLSEFNQKTGDRNFMIGSSYEIDNNLGDTKEGKMLVYGQNKTGEDVLDGKEHSLFNIKENTAVELEISDLTVQNAGTNDSKGGSVVHNNSNTSKVELSNVTIKDNKNGAVYNNGGKNDKEGNGFYISGTTFEGNATGFTNVTSDSLGVWGAAVYNDAGGLLYLENDVFAEGQDSAKNDIYNAGDIYVNGENTFKSQIKNADTGMMAFYGHNTVSSIDNDKGNLKFAGESNTVDQLTNQKGQVILESRFAQFGSVSNSGEITVSGGTAYIDELKLNNQEQNGQLSVDGGSMTLNTVSGKIGSSVDNKGNLALTGDASGFMGTFTQEDGVTTVTENARFFSGDSQISGGVLNWVSTNDLSDDATLTVEGDSTLIVGAESRARRASSGAVLTLKNDSSIDAKVFLATGSTLNVEENGSLTMNEGSLWNGTIHVDAGELTLKTQSPIQTETGALVALTGSVTLEETASLNVNADSTIEGEVIFTGNENTNLFISGGSVTFNDEDTVKGNTFLNAGTLTYGDASVDENASLTATGGHLNIVDGASLTVDAEKNTIADAVNLSIDESSSVTVLSGGRLGIDEQDLWLGQITLDGGTLDYSAQTNGALTANTGALNLTGGVLTLNDASVIKDTVSVNIQNDATVKVEKGGALTLNGHTEDKWFGLVENNGGTVTTLGVDTTTEGFAGRFKQTAGNSIFDASSNIVIANPGTSILGGNVSVLNGSTLSFVDGEDIQLKNLTVSDNSSFGIKNGQAQTVTLDSLTVNGENNFTMDLQGVSGNGDQIVVEDLNGNGTINVSDFGFSGSVPTSRQVDMQLFHVQNIGENVSFKSTSGAVSTPLGDYILQSLGNGSYRATLNTFNPAVYRGQASTLAMYNNQLEIDDMILNHIILENGFGQQAVAQSKADKTHLNRDGGWWSKAYYNNGRMDLSYNLDTDTTAYGLFIGADLPMMNLGYGWNFIPSFFAGYNGSKQDYNDIDMKQNGGQGGVMGTFAKNNFIASVMVYGGGYSNKMKGNGYEDSTHNWFAGTAAKAAYNWYVADQVIVQPAAFVSYNAFGKQDWHTQFGNMNMSADTLNGFSVAPGINVIYAPKTWSTYASLQYVYNVNNKVGGRAGTDVDLPKLKTDNGFVQYGIGATKALSDQWNTDFRVTAESGGRTGVGFRLGAEYLFDTKSWLR